MLENGTNLGTSVATAYSNLVNGAFIAPGTNNGSGGMQIVLPDPLTGGSYTFDISESFVTPTQQTWFDIAKAVGAWVIVVVTFCAILQSALEMVDKFFGQRQIEGNKQSGFGWDADLPSGLFYAAVFASVIGAFPVAVAAFCTTTGFTAANVQAAAASYNAVTSSPMWTLCTEWIPVATLVTAFFSWALITYFYGPLLLITGRSVLMMLLASFVIGLFVVPGRCEGMTVINNSGAYCYSLYSATNGSNINDEFLVLIPPGATINLEKVNYFEPLAIYTNANMVASVFSFSPIQTFYDSFDPPATVMIGQTSGSHFAADEFLGNSRSAWFLDGFYAAGAGAALWATIWAYKKGIAPQVDFKG
jgi:hypothetical protein